MKNDSRYEIKYIISYLESLTFIRKLDLVLSRDQFSLREPYVVSSLYFDDIDNTSYHEKIKGSSIAINIGSSTIIIITRYSNWNGKRNKTSVRTRILICF